MQSVVQPKDLLMFDGIATFVVPSKRHTTNIQPQRGHCPDCQMALPNSANAEHLCVSRNKNAGILFPPSPSYDA
jgi:hypothetical protein